MAGAQVKCRRLHKLATQLSFNKVLHSWHHLVRPAHQLVYMSRATKINSPVHNQAASTNAICMQSSIALSQGDVLNTFMSPVQGSCKTLANHVNATGCRARVYARWE